MTFGDKLSALRREQNYTQEQLADLLGVSRQSVSKWESGAAYPETEKLIRLSTLFNCSLDYLLRDAPREAAAAPTAPQQAEAVPDAAGGRFVVTVPYPCYERKSRRQLFGMPLYHVNIGPGRVAKGFFAVGLIARGVVSVGLISIGFVSVGLISIGLLALGLDAIGLIAMGGVAIGAVALGAAALGLFAAGGAAGGLYAVGAAAAGRFAALGSNADGPISIGTVEALGGEIFRKLGTLSPQEKHRVLRLLDETAPVWLRWAAALFALFL